MPKILSRALRNEGELVKISPEQAGLLRCYQFDENSKMIHMKTDIEFNAASDLNGANGFATGAIAVITTLPAPTNVVVNVGDAESARFAQIGTLKTDTGLQINTQGAPTAKTVSATLTTAELLAGIITVNQGAAGASALQLPTVEDLESDLEMLKLSNNDSFDVSVINTSTVDAEDASITTNTGWTLVGDMSVPARSATGSLNCSGLFRLRRVSDSAWTAYRIA